MSKFTRPELAKRHDVEERYGTRFADFVHQEPDGIPGDLFRQVRTSVCALTLIPWVEEEKETF